MVNAADGPALAFGRPLPNPPQIMKKPWSFCYTLLPF
jgi:hypothetical protein